jgi:hypothetical protein
LEKKKVTPFDSPVSIHVHSRRRKLIDLDNISYKACGDSLIAEGILHDDSAQFISAIRLSQEKISKDEWEETIITIEEI